MNVFERRVLAELRKLREAEATLERYVRDVTTFPHHRGFIYGVTENFERTGQPVRNAFGACSMNALLVLVLLLLLLGILPTWPYSANWGYYPSGGLGLLLIVLLVVLLTRKRAL